VNSFFLNFLSRLTNSPTRLLGDGFAFLSGSLLPLAFAPYSFSLLALISPTLLFLLWQNCSPKRAFWRGLLFGIGYFGFGVSWVVISLHQFGGIFFLGALALTGCFILLFALYPALLGWLMNRQFHNTPPSAKYLLILPAGWTLQEWLRGWFLSGFPWLSLGYSQIDSPLSGFAPILGVYGLSWLLALSASMIVYGIQVTQWKLRSLLVLTIAMLWLGGGFLATHSWTQPTGDPFKVALIQGNHPEEFKWITSYQKPSMERYLYLSQAHREADMIIWPETAIPMFYQDIPIYYPGFLEKLAQEMAYHTDFFIGIPLLNQQDNTYYNGLLSFGQQPGFYYKHHLVPFGEYIPLQKLFGNLLNLFEVPLSEFTAGAAKQAPLYGAGQPIGVSICYEDAFGDLIRRQVPQTTVLVNISNDAWFGDSIAPHQHLEIARMRALENGRYFLRATNTGISAVINHQGEIITQTPQFKVITLRATVQPYQGTTPYTDFGEVLIMIIIWCGIVAGILIGWRNQQVIDHT